jgi:hypothetical protein
MNTQRVSFGRGELFRVQLFTSAEAQEISVQVDTVPAGLRRPADPPPTASGMSTIGEALYRNRRIYRHFHGLYERVAVFFEERYSAPVVFAEDLAVPGFHVFDYPQPGVYDGGGWHFDTLYLQIPFLAAHRTEITDIVNFTLPVQVPSGGTGMDLCDDGPGDDGQGRGTLISTPYVPGVLVFSEHEYWHRIGESRCLEDGERRITLQGHGVYFRFQWLLFW